MRSYIGGMEFIGNTLELVHHGSGYVRNTNAANNGHLQLSGPANANHEALSISSSQMESLGQNISYEVKDFINLTPGFEAAAGSIFVGSVDNMLATVANYEWLYKIEDHLGNTRVLFSDKNNDNSINQTANPNTNEVLQFYNYSSFGMEMGGAHLNASRDQNPYTYNNKEDISFSGYLDYGARCYDASIGRWTAVDPLADWAPDWSTYRYGFNNPILYTDPTGLYEWRVNSETGEYERFGDKGGNEEQFIYWNDSKESAFSLMGETIHVGAVADNWHTDGEFSFGVSTQDLWSNIPDEYTGAYTASDLAEREEARQAGGAKYESIRQQEQAGLARRDQIWNTSDYGRHLDNTYGNRSGMIMAYDLGLIDAMLPGGIRRGASHANRAMSGTNLARANQFKGPVGYGSAIANSQLSNNSWIRFLQVNKGKYKGLGKNWIRKAAADYHAQK